jgi:rhodanese-related sulfurtransferase
MYKMAAGLVAKQGYSNVMTFKGGLPAWVQAGFPISRSGPLDKEKIPTVSADELNGSLGGFLVVDIRPESLYKMGWIPGSIKIPLGKLSAEYAVIEKGKPVVVVDHAGKQVLVASRFLKRNGYTDVRRLEGGLMVWSMKGYRLEK